MTSLAFAWRGKPLSHLTRDELLDAARDLAAEVVRLEHENEQLRRGYSPGAARPRFGKPKEDHEITWRGAL